MLDPCLILVPTIGVMAIAVGVLRRGRLLVVPIGTCTVLVASVVVWKLSSMRAAVLGPTLLRVETTAPLVALTLDDGPTPAYTQPVLDCLDAARAKATFFVVGESLQAHPKLGRAILACGHELGNHSWTHSRLVFRRPSTLRSEVERTDALLREVGQREPIAFRPPYGKRLLDLHAVLGERPAVLWDIEPESYAELAEDPHALAAHVIQRARAGSVILLHTMFASRDATRAALPELLDGLAAKGLRVTTLSELQSQATAAR